MVYTLLSRMLVLVCIVRQPRLGGFLVSLVRLTFQVSLGVSFVLAKHAWKRQCPRAIPSIRCYVFGIPK